MELLEKGKRAVYFVKWFKENYRIRHDRKKIVIGEEMKLRRGANFLELFGDEVANFTAAKGHFGRKLNKLIKNYAVNLGFEYLSASNKEEFITAIEHFTSKKNTDKSIVLEVFTNEHDETLAIDMVENIEQKEKDATCQVIGSHMLWNNGEKKNVVLWGSGETFRKYINQLYICDNDNLKWGKKILGIECISPEQLLRIKDVYVIIMIQNINVAFQIANQLLDMGIKSFDTVFNFLRYDNCEELI